MGSSWGGVFRGKTVIKIYYIKKCSIKKFYNFIEETMVFQ